MWLDWRREMVERTYRGVFVSFGLFAGASTSPFFTSTLSSIPSFKTSAAFWRSMAFELLWYLPAYILAFEVLIIRVLQPGELGRVAWYI